MLDYENKFISELQAIDWGRSRRAGRSGYISWQMHGNQSKSQKLTFLDGRFSGNKYRSL